MKTCFLCEKEYPTKDVRSWYGLLEHICTTCSAKYRCLKLAIFCTDIFSSLIPVPGAIKYRIAGFGKNAKGRTDYSKPILKPFESDQGIGIGASSERAETEKAEPTEHYASQGYSRLESGSSAGLFDETPPLSDTRTTRFNTGTNTPSSRCESHEITPFRTGLSKAHRYAWEADDRLRETTGNPCGAEGGLQETEDRCQAEDRFREVKGRLRQAEDRLRQAEDRLRQAEDRLRQAEDRLC